MKFRNILVTISISLILSLCSNKNDEVESVKIGNQIWMTKNLAVETFRNGDPIPIITDRDEWHKANNEGRAACCYLDNDKEKEAIYGKLYNWHAINDPRGLAPEGWKIPTNIDWVVLARSTGGFELGGKSLKSKQFWKNDQGNNDSKFDAMGGGYRDDRGIYSAELLSGNWWSSTSSRSNEIQAVRMSLYYKSDEISLSNYYKGNGYSVRCIKTKSKK